MPLKWGKPLSEITPSVENETPDPTSGHLMAAAGAQQSQNNPYITSNNDANGAHGRLSTSSAAADQQQQYYGGQQQQANSEKDLNSNTCQPTSATDASSAYLSTPSAFQTSSSSVGRSGGQQQQQDGDGGHQQHHQMMHHLQHQGILGGEHIRHDIWSSSIIFGRHPQAIISMRERETEREREQENRSREKRENYSPYSVNKLPVNESFDSNDVLKKELQRSQNSLTNNWIIRQRTALSDNKVHCGIKYFVVESCQENWCFLGLFLKYISGLKCVIEWQSTCSWLFEDCNSSWSLVHFTVFMHFFEHIFAQLGTFTCICMGLGNLFTNFWLRAYLLANRFFFFV